MLIKDWKSEWKTNLSVVYMMLRPHDLKLRHYQSLTMKSLYRLRPCPSPNRRCVGSQQNQRQPWGCNRLYSLVLFTLISSPCVGCSMHRRKRPRSEGRLLCHLRPGCFFVFPLLLLFFVCVIWTECKQTFFWPLWSIEFCWKEGMKIEMHLFKYTVQCRRTKFHFGSLAHAQT